MISIEPIVFTIRIGANHKNYGDPYEYVCTAIKISPTEVRIIGYVGKISIPIYKRLREKLEECGIAKFSWERIK